MSTPAAVFDVDEVSFQRDVIERSVEVPVVVDFWAAWCGPCKQLGPVLERLATEAEGAWVLAKVDVDRNQRLAGAAGVQGIPAVRAFKGGRQVAGFVGARSEADVREWLRALQPGPADVAFERGVAVEAEGDLEGAAGAYREALSHAPAHEGALRNLTAVELRLRASGRDLGELRRDADPHDVRGAIQLADAEMVHGEVESALARLVEAVALNSGDDREAARAHLVELMGTLDPDDPCAVRARRALSRVLF